MSSSNNGIPTAQIDAALAAIAAYRANQIGLEAARQQIDEAIPIGARTEYYNQLARLPSPPTSNLPAVGTGASSVPPGTNPSSSTSNVAAASGGPPPGLGSSNPTPTISGGDASGAGTSSSSGNVSAASAPGPGEGNNRQGIDGTGTTEPGHVPPSFSGLSGQLGTRVNADLPNEAFLLELGRAAYRKRVSSAEPDDDGQPSTKRQADSSRFAWRVGLLNGLSELDGGIQPTELAQSIARDVQNYMTDVKAAVKDLRHSFHRPDFPDSLLPDLLWNTYIDLAKVSGHFKSVKPEHEQSHELGGEARLVLGTKLESSAVTTHGDWITAFSTYQDALVMVFPRLFNPSMSYFRHINNLFKFLEHDHAAIINYDAALRLDLSRRPQLTLDDHGHPVFNVIRTKWLSLRYNPNPRRPIASTSRIPSSSGSGTGSASGSVSRSTAGTTPGGRKKLDVPCDNWNAQRCGMGRECRRLHICNRCRGPHVADACPGSGSSGPSVPRPAPAPGSKH